MKVIILAGGLGTRLRSTVNDVPKPMALIANKPFLEHLLDYLLLQGCNEVILATGYLHQKIIDYFSNSYKTLKITYSVESTPLGTGGAILQALNFVKEDENVFIINGDTFCKVNYKTFFSYHLSNKSNLSMVITKVNNADRYGVVQINSTNIITKFSNDNKNESSFINCGIYLLNKKIFSGLNFQVNFSFENDFLYPLVNRLNILAYINNEFFIDIGVPEDYKYLNKLLGNSK